MKGLCGAPVLLIIDVQKGFDLPYWGVRNNPDAESNVAALLKLWRETARPVVHIRHDSVEPESPLRPGQSGNDFKDIVVPVAGEHVERKQVNSAFIGTGLEQYLRSNGFDTIVIVGLSTDHCVSTSTRMAGNLGFKAYVVSDATATFNRTDNQGNKYPAESVHAYALASLHGEFATVVTTQEIVSACTSSV